MGQETAIIRPRLKNKIKCGNKKFIELPVVSICVRGVAAPAVQSPPAGWDRRYTFAGGRCARAGPGPSWCCRVFSTWRADFGTIPVIRIVKYRKTGGNWLIINCFEFFCIGKNYFFMQKLLKIKINLFMNSFQGVPS